MADFATPPPPLPVDQNTLSCRKNTAFFSVNQQAHLSMARRVNLGSFYTPAKYVGLVGKWLKTHGVDSSWTIADLSCGYGAFFELTGMEVFSCCRFVGNDIDSDAVAHARTMFPQVDFSVENALYDVCREKFLLSEDEKLAIVGNPPYNDVTSQANQKLKTADLPIDSAIKTRDLGMSSLLAYNKLKANFVAVLHPLSYLIKPANFRALKPFFRNYELLEHIIFSSQEFAGTSKLQGFPVIVALYRRVPGRGLASRDIRTLRFQTVEGCTFSLSQFDFVTDFVQKYPHKGRYSPEILFYTMRDINALKRSRTFISERIVNAVDVKPEQFAYYCYIDCFKRYADVPYWMGNLDVPFIKNSFGEVADVVVADAKFHNQAVFGLQPSPTPIAVARICNYIDKSMNRES